MFGNGSQSAVLGYHYGAAVLGHSVMSNRRAPRLLVNDRRVGQRLKIPPDIEVRVGPNLTRKNTDHLLLGIVWHDDCVV